MTTGRELHSAGIATDSETGEEILFVIGGWTNNEPITSVEILRGEQWVQGREFNLNSILQGIFFNLFHIAMALSISSKYLYSIQTLSGFF